MRSSYMRAEGKQAFDEYNSQLLGFFIFFFFFQCKELCILVEMSVKLSYTTMKILLFKLRTLCCLSLNILDSL